MLQVTFQETQKSTIKFSWSSSSWVNDQNMGNIDFDTLLALTLKLLQPPNQTQMSILIKSYAICHLDQIGFNFWENP